MDCKEYIMRLTKALRGLPDAADMVADIEEHFRNGLASGKSEAELCGALQPPESLAREYRALAIAKKSPETPGLAASFGILTSAANARLARGRSRMALLALGLAGGLGLLGVALLGVRVALAAGFSNGGLLPGPGSFSLPPAVYILLAAALFCGGLAALAATAVAIRNSGKKVRRELLGQ